MCLVCGNHMPLFAAATYLHRALLQHLCVAASMVLLLPHTHTTGYPPFAAWYTLCAALPHPLDMLLSLHRPLGGPCLSSSIPAGRPCQGVLHGLPAQHPGHQGGWPQCLPGHPEAGGIQVQEPALQLLVDGGRQAGGPGAELWCGRCRVPCAGGLLPQAAAVLHHEEVGVVDCQQKGTQYVCGEHGPLLCAQVLVQV
jgi:hypothetical protein